MEQKNRYDERGNADEYGRYDRSGNYVYTASERTWALLIGVMLLALRHQFGSVLDKLPYPGVIKGVLTCAIGFAVWVAVIGRAHPDPD